LLFNPFEFVSLAMIFYGFYGFSDLFILLKNIYQQAQLDVFSNGESYEATLES